MSKVEKRKKKASLKDFAVKLSATVISPSAPVEHQLADNDDNSFVLTFRAPVAGLYTVVVTSSVHPPRKSSKTNSSDTEDNDEPDEPDLPLPPTPVVTVDSSLKPAVPAHKPPPVPLSLPPPGSSSADAMPRSPRGNTSAPNALSSSPVAVSATSEAVSFGAPITEKPAVTLPRYTSTPHAVSAISTFRQPSSPRTARGEPQLPARPPLRGRAQAVRGGADAPPRQLPQPPSGGSAAFRSAPNRPPPTLAAKTVSTPASPAASAAPAATPPAKSVSSPAAATPTPTPAPTSTVAPTSSDKRKERRADVRKSQRFVADKLEAHSDDVSDLLQASKDMPDDPTKHHALGFAYANLQHNHEAAIKAYDRAIELDDSVDEYHNDRGVSLYELGRYDDAVKAYERALALAPDHAMALINCGNAFRQLSRLDDALPLYDRAVQSDPTLVAAWVNRANARRAARRWRDAADDYRRALELDSGDVQVIAKLGHVLRELGDSAGAKQLLRECVDGEPSDAAPYLALCSVLEHSGELQEAVKVARSAVMLFPRDALCLLQLGTLLYQTGDAAQSAALCEQATTIDNTLTDAWNQLGVSRMACDRVNEAEQAFQRAVTAAAADKAALASATCNLGYLYDQIGRYDDAKVFFLRSLEAEPKNAATLNKMGACLVNAKQVPEALRYFEQALAIDERNISVHYNLAAAHANSGRLPVALTHCQRALEIDPQFVPAASMLSQLQAVLNKSKK